MKLYQLIAELRQLEKQGLAGATIRGPVKQCRDSRKECENFSLLKNITALKADDDISVILVF